MFKPFTVYFFTIIIAPILTLRRAPENITRGGKSVHFIRKFAMLCNDKYIEFIENAVFNKVFT